MAQGFVGLGVSQVMDHPWFATVDFRTLERKEYKAPYIPTIKSPFGARLPRGERVGGTLVGVWAHAWHGVHEPPRLSRRFQL